MAARGAATTRQHRVPALIAALLLQVALVLLRMPGEGRAERADHRVTSIPGLGTPRTRHWSGYLDVEVPGQDTRAYVHYWLVENDRGGHAPTVAWFQGGPGGSSMIGLFTENGPFTLNDFSLQTPAPDGSDSPRVFENPHSWHKMPANMLYVEHPAPTGFSYCAPNPCRWNDTSQSEVSYRFIERFFEEYAELANSPFYLTGESYAGVLVPTLSHQILAHRTAENRERAPWNLRGIALGNACPGNRVMTCTPYSGWLGARVAVDFRYYRGMMSETKYNKIQEACEGHWDTFEPPASEECRDLLEDPIRPVLSETGDTDRMGGGYFIYDTCKTDLAETATPAQIPSGHWKELVEVKRRQLADDGDASPQPNSGEYFCGQERISVMYLNRADVQRALHVRPTEFAFSTSLDYAFTAHSLLDLYRNELVDQIDIMQYSGDADPCVPYVGTQRWIRSLELDEEAPWSPWQSPEDASAPAGYLTRFVSYNGKHRFWFATVRDAGHMVPRYKSEPALHLLRMFVDNAP